MADNSTSSNTSSSSSLNSTNRNQVTEITNKTEYMNAQNLADLWLKIKSYVADNASGNIDLTSYATKEYVTQAISNIPTIDLSSYETKDALATALLDYAKKSEIPTVPSKVSAFTNDANYVTSSELTTDLSNYYQKSETYSKTEVDTKITSGTGTAGADGYSPTATVTQTDTGATISITDKTGTTTANITNGTNGTDGSNGSDGISPTATVASTSTGATISITDKNGTTTASVTNGTNGSDGTSGTDGVSPTIVTNSANSDTVYKLDITDKNGTFTTPNLKGADGSSGGGGSSSSDVYSTTETAIGTWIDGKTIYRKVIQLTGNSIYFDAQSSMPSIGATIETVVNARVFLISSPTSTTAMMTFPLNYFDSFTSSASGASTLLNNINKNVMWFTIDNEKVYYYIGSNHNFGTTSLLTAIVEYTKAT